MAWNAASDRLDALERRGDELVAFADCRRQATAYIAKEGTQTLVNELKQAVADQRRVRMGTINTLILMAHIERLEAELAKEPLRLA